MNLDQRTACGEPLNASRAQEVVDASLIEGVADAAGGETRGLLPEEFRHAAVDFFGRGRAHIPIARQFGQMPFLAAQLAAGIRIEAARDDLLAGAVERDAVAFIRRILMRQE